MSSFRNMLGITKPGVRLLLVLAAVAACPAADALAAGPANDAFDHAQPIRPGTTFRGTTADATMERGEPRPYPGAPTVWYRFRATRKVTIALAVCPFDSYFAAVSVFTGRSLRSLRRIDFRSGDRLFGRCSRRVAFTARPGRTYRIAVAGHLSQQPEDEPYRPGRTRHGGPFGLRVRAIDAPPNDDFADAAAITVGESVRGRTYDATLELGEPKADPLTVWYRLQVSAPTDVELIVAGRSDQEAYVYTGRTVNRLNPVLNDYPLQAKPGVIYRIQVSNYSLDFLEGEAQRRRRSRFKLSLRVFNETSSSARNVGSAALP